jgi:glucans biosynthesis protein
MNRREFLLAAGSGALGALGSGTISPAVAAEARQGFSRATVVDIARDLAGKVFEPPAEVPQPFADLGYDQYRDIRFKKDLAWWTGEERGFTLEPLHAGFIFKTPVDIHIVENGNMRPIRYASRLFDFGPRLNVPPTEGVALFSGIRLLAPINTIGRFDEFAVFQGASYFRALGAGQTYGASARGLAIDTAEPKGEEFPIFRSYWVERPERKAKTIVVHALLDSVGVTGAFTFGIRPGRITEMEVQATLFARRELGHLGLAPFTSMYLFASPERPRFDDYRDAVHDSDTLTITGSDSGWIARPLANPKTLQVSSFTDSRVRGFGLQQRARRFSDFKDLEARYELRPSVWAEPKLGWEAGQVELVEIPTDREFNDNIVALWRPHKPLRPGQSLSYVYWLHWGPPVVETQLARVKGTRQGLTLDHARRLFVVEFESPKSAVSASRSTLGLGNDVMPRVSASKGAIKNVVGQHNAIEGGYRVTFELDVGGVDLSELRLHLTRHNETISEVWVYRWTP